MSDTSDRILGWCAAPRGEACRFIVTPNVDHAVMFQHRSDLRDAYADAALVLADGLPLVIASKVFRKSLPERVAGSDLVPRLLTSGEPLRVFLLGAARAWPTRLPSGSACNGHRLMLSHALSTNGL